MPYQLTKALNLVQIMSAIIWTPLKYFISAFHYNLDILAAIWIILYMNWTPSIGLKILQI
jgi:hypothetical protein